MSTHDSTSQTPGTGTLVTSYKGLDDQFRCRGFQYAVGKTYQHEGDLMVCLSGFHACEHPLDVWGYYGPAASRFAMVEQSGTIDRASDDSKLSSTNITIKNELTLDEFIDEAVHCVIKNTHGVVRNYERAAVATNRATLAASGNQASLAASGSSTHLAAYGNFVRLAASGRYAKAAVAGDFAGVATSGPRVQIGVSGSSARLAASGDETEQAVCGDQARPAASGDSAVLSVQGDDARLAASGSGIAQLSSSGAGGVIVSCADRALAKGSVGTWIALAEYAPYTRQCIGFAVGCIGYDGLDPDVYYYACGGRLIKKECRTP